MKFYSNDEKTVASNSFESIGWFKPDKDGKSKEVIILSHISPKNVKDKYDMSQDMIKFPAWQPFVQGGVKNDEGETVFLSPLPYLDIDSHPENSENEFVNIIQLLGVKEQVRDYHLMWVYDIEEEQILLYNPPVSVVNALLSNEEEVAKRGRVLKGMSVSIKRVKNGKKTDYSVTLLPFDSNKIKVTDEDGKESFVEISQNTDWQNEINYPCDLREVPVVKFLDTVDKQVTYLNKMSGWIKSMKEWTDEEYPFTEDNKIKPQFVK